MRMRYPELMQEISHSVRNSLLGRERTYTLAGSGVEWRDNKSRGQVPYTSVSSIGLLSYMSLDGQIGQCTIRSRKHGQLKLRSHSYEKLGVFDNRSATYGPFVRALCKRVAQANPEARFQAGNDTLWLLWLIFFRWLSASSC